MLTIVNQGSSLTIVRDDPSLTIVFKKQLYKNGHKLFTKNVRFLKVQNEWVIFKNYSFFPKTKLSFQKTIEKRKKTIVFKNNKQPYLQKVLLYPFQVTRLFAIIMVSEAIRYMFGNQIKLSFPVPQGLSYSDFGRRDIAHLNIENFLDTNRNYGPYLRVDIFRNPSQMEIRLSRQVF